MTKTTMTVETAAVIGAVLMDAYLSGDREEFMGRAGALYDSLSGTHGVSVDDVLPWMLDEDSSPSGCRDDDDRVLVFWNDVKDVLVWDFAPFQFLYDLYVAWMDRTGPAKPLGRNTFIERLADLVPPEPSGPGAQWICEDPKKAYRHNGRLCRYEPLIAKYRLKNWARAGAVRKDGKAYATPTKEQLSDTYRGLLRRSAGSAKAA